jgi:cytosine/adenosine deaminase-related metal-dependent hydrolase
MNATRLTAPVCALITWCIVGSCSPVSAATPADDGPSYVLVGHIPGMYIAGAAPDRYIPGAVTIEQGVITAVERVANPDTYVNPRGLPTIILRQATGQELDVIYPGLFNLHNHTKQNVLSVWSAARGQFANRFEWRAWSGYTGAVSGNMNPWIGYGAPVTCAAFRLSEALAASLGTTYLQGPSSCVSNWGVQQVEDANAFTYVSASAKQAPVQAPTDLILPAEMAFVWNVVVPKMLVLGQIKASGDRRKDYPKALKKGVTYEQGLKAVLADYCDATFVAQIHDVNGANELKLLSTRAEIERNCREEVDEVTPLDQLPIGKSPKGFVRYVYYVHKTIAGKKNYLASGRASAIIAHLAEGRRHDPYNTIEFDLVRVLQMDRPGVTFVHGVGINKDGYTLMGKTTDARHPFGMGLVWSPFSNLLLYGETADIAAAKKAGVTIALGSDWTPTGTKSTLEELKVAKAYIGKDPLHEGLAGKFPDVELYKMVTENPAKLVNHFEDIKKVGHATDGEHGAGSIAVDAAASLVVVTKTHTNPYSNLVQADAKDVNLTIVGGHIVYGNVPYLNQFNALLAASRLDVEAVEDFSAPLSQLKAADFAPPPGLGEVGEDGDDGDAEAADDGGTAGADEKLAHLVTVAKSANLDSFTGDKQLCNFPQPKAFVVQRSGDVSIARFKEQAGLDLDRVGDIQKLLGLSLMTQSRNMWEPAASHFAPTYFPPLYTCDDRTYSARLTTFVSREYAKNASDRQANRVGFGSVPAKMARDYGLKYDPSKVY